MIISIHFKQKLQCTDLVEIRHLGDIDEIDDSEVLHLFSDAVECLIHRHALTIPVVSKAHNNNAVFFGFDGLIHVPTRGKMWKKVRHDEGSTRATAWWL